MERFLPNQPDQIAPSPVLLVSILEYQLASVLKQPVSRGEALSSLNHPIKSHLSFSSPWSNHLMKIQDTSRPTIKPYLLSLLESSFNTMKHVSKQLLHFVGHFPRNFMAECSHKDQQQKQPTIVAEQEKSPHSRVIGTNFKISILHKSAHLSGPAVCIKMSSTNTTFTTFWIHSSSNELQDNKNWVQRRDESLCSTGEACLPSFHCTSSFWSGSHKNQFAVFLLT